MKLHKLYRKTMRTLALFILGFDRCPVDCRRNYKADACEIVKAIVGGLVFITLFVLTVLALA